MTLPRDFIAFVIKLLLQGRWTSNEDAKQQGGGETGRAP